MAFFPKEQPSVQKTQEVMRSDNQTQSAEGIIKELVRYFFLFVVLLCCFYFIFHFCNLSLYFCNYQYSYWYTQLLLLL